MVSKKYVRSSFRGWDNNVFLVLAIPKIDFRRNVYSFDSSLNNVDKNVMLLNETDVTRKNFFLAGHSGTASNCFFNDLIYLDVMDNVYIYYKDKVFKYVIMDIFYIEKNGFLSVDDEDGVLFLITCSLKYSGMQLIIKGVIYE